MAAAAPQAAGAPQAAPQFQQPAAAPVAPTPNPPSWVAGASQRVAAAPATPAGVLLPGSAADWQEPLAAALFKVLGQPVSLGAGAAPAGAIPLHLAAEGGDARLSPAAVDAALVRWALGF